jgi:RHS repeat-associated protein
MIRIYAYDAAGFNYDALSCTLGNSAPWNAYKFTGKERDTESGLDNFGARYNASTIGRFMSPDPVGGHTEDPQTLNRYAYVRNSPLNLTDPTGLDFYLKCQSSDNSGCTQVQIDPNNNSRTWVQADQNGSATIITSDSIRAGQNTATLDENGVQINGNNQGIYFDNPTSHSADANGNDVNNNPLNLAGSGNLQDFNFHIDSNCGGSCWTAGKWTFSGRAFSGISDLLDQRGAFNIPGEDAVAFLGYGAHPYTTQHRFGGPLNSLIFRCRTTSRALYPLIRWSTCHVVVASTLIPIRTGWGMQST